MRQQQPQGFARPARTDTPFQRLRQGLKYGVMLCSLPWLISCSGSDPVAPAASNSATTPSSGSATPTTPISPSTPVTTGAVPRAVCGPGSQPETGIQGQVPLADRTSGRSQQGYSCNLERIGQYQGEGTAWVNPAFHNCAYMATSFSGIPTKKSQGVQVVDVTDPTHPVFSTNLTSPAMLAGPWESLKTNEKRGLLAGVAVGPVLGAAFFDVYDANADCAHPKLMNSLGGLTVPANVIGHEGNWSPDGMTYWASGLGAGSLTAIDVKDPTKPTIVYTGSSVMSNHGFSFSADGNRMYLATVVPAGLTILDVSDIQKRAPVPMIKQIGSVSWNTQGISQHTIPVSYNGKAYVIATDETQAEVVRIIDISDETKPLVVTHILLEIHLPQNAALRTQDTDGNGSFGYEGHYCTVDHQINPTALACGLFQSGIRVFNIADPLKPREIAYYNPPAQVGKNALLAGSEHVSGVVTKSNPALATNLTADWCSSPPRFVGSNQLWATCQDNGVQILRFTNGAFTKITNSSDPKLELRTYDD